MSRDPRKELVSGICLIRHLCGCRPTRPSVLGEGQSDVRVCARRPAGAVVDATPTWEVRPSHEYRAVRGYGCRRKTVRSEAATWDCAECGISIPEPEAPRAGEIRGNVSGGTPVDAAVGGLGELDAQRSYPSNEIGVEDKDGTVWGDYRKAAGDGLGELSAGTDGHRGRPGRPAIARNDGLDLSVVQRLAIMRVQEIRPRYVDVAPEGIPALRVYSGKPGRPRPVL